MSLRASLLFGLALLASLSLVGISTVSAGESSVPDTVDASADNSSADYDDDHRWGYFNIQKFTTPDGAKLAYRATKQCKHAVADSTILYFHCTASSSAFFGAQLGDPTGVFADHNLCQIALDFRGNGDSEDVGPYTFSQYAQDAKSLLDHFNLPAAHIAGWSQGGPVSMYLHKQYPEVFKSLTFISSAPQYENSPPGFNATLPYTLGYANDAAVQASIQNTQTLLNTGGTNGSNRTAYDNYFYSIFDADYGTASNQADATAIKNALIIEGNKSSYNCIMGNKYEWANMGQLGIIELSKFTVPVSNYGEVGPELKFQGNGNMAMSNYMASIIPLPGATPYTQINGPLFNGKGYYGTGHVLFIQDYVQFNYDLADFVSRLLTLPKIADPKLFGVNKH